MPRVICPCCKGTKYLLVYDIDDQEAPPVRHQCNHCQGEGTIEAEVEE